MKITSCILCQKSHDYGNQFETTSAQVIIIAKIIA